MIRHVISKGKPATWILDLKRANNHNCTTLPELQKVLKPIEEADEAKRKFREGTGKGDAGCGRGHD